MSALLSVTSRASCVLSAGKRGSRTIAGVGAAWFASRLGVRWGVSKHEDFWAESTQGEAPSPRRRRRRWTMLLVVVGVALVVVAGVLLGSGLVQVTGNFGGTSQGPGSAATSSPSLSPPKAIVLEIAASKVEVGELFDVWATMTSPDPSSVLELQQRGDDGIWRRVASAGVQPDGRALFDDQVLYEAGIVQLQAYEAGMDESTRVYSEPIDVRAGRKRTNEVSVSWPEFTIAHCSTVNVLVKVLPVEAGRIVELDLLRGGDVWETVATGRTGIDGFARVRTPDCGAARVESFRGARWRISVPETGSMSSFEGEEHQLRFCPAPGPVTNKVLRNSDTGPAYLRVTNPSEDCGAIVTIQAILQCYFGSGPGSSGQKLGFREARSPMVLEPGQTKVVSFWKIFSRAYKECQDWKAGSGLYEDPDAVITAALEFFPP